jgi:hypothetical protein
MSIALSGDSEWPAKWPVRTLLAEAERSIEGAKNAPTLPKGGGSMRNRTKRIAVSLGWLAALIVASGAGWRY